MKQILFVLALLTMAQPVYAQDCSAVSDTASMFQNPGSVRAAAAGVHGADVRVFTLRDLNGYGSLDLYTKDLAARCPGWLGPDGAYKTNLLVFALSKQERQMGIFYGAAFSDQLRNEYLRIQQNIMRPQLRAGYPDRAIVAGLGEANRLIQASFTPVAAPAPTTPPVVIQTQPAAPTDYTPLKVLGYILLGLGVLGGSVFLFIRRADRKNRLETAQSEAQRLTTNIAAWLPRLKTKLTNATGDVTLSQTDVQEANSLYSFNAEVFPSLVDAPADASLDVWEARVRALEGIQLALGKAESLLTPRRAGKGSTPVSYTETRYAPIVPGSIKPIAKPTVPPYSAPKKSQEADWKRPDPSPGMIPIPIPIPVETKRETERESSSYSSSRSSSRSSGGSSSYSSSSDSGGSSSWGGSSDSGGSSSYGGDSGSSSSGGDSGGSSGW